MKIQPLKAQPCLLIGMVALLLSSCGTNNLSNANTQENSGWAGSTINIGGSSETYSVLEVLTNAYRSENNGIEFKFMPPSQSSGAIEGVKQETIDVGGVSRAVTAHEAGTQIQYLPLVETPLVVTVHNSVTNVTNISSEQLRAIYKGDLSNWQQLGGPDAAIVLLDFTEEENEKQVLRQTYLGEDLKITPQAIVFSEDEKLMTTVGDTPFSIAVLPIDDDMDEMPVTMLSIDGVTPSQNTLQSGTYKMKLPMGIVLPTDPKPELQAFIQFVQGTQGQQALSTAGLSVVQTTQK
jgi:phosphate transport system substrate-binding protein